MRVTPACFMSDLALTGCHKLIVTKVLFSFEQTLMLCLLGKKYPLCLQKASYFLLQTSVNNVCILESLGGLQDCISPRMLLYLYLLYFVLSS